MDRRVFLAVTGAVAVAGALQALPAAAARRSDVTPRGLGAGVALKAVPSGVQVTVREPGEYRITGLVRFDAPQVEISGVAHSQSISWSGIDGSERFTSFTTFERFDTPGMTRTIRVSGGHLEGVSAAPVYFDE